VTRTRKSASERREQVVEVAVRQFAVGGYHGTSTEAIAQETELSQPYLFRLFGTKKGLFLACHEQMHESVVEAFRAAAVGDTVDERMHNMGEAYIELLRDRHLLLFQMQAYAACSDPDIQAQVRQRYGELVREIGRLSGADAERVRGFCAQGMLLNVSASLDFEAVAHDDVWAAMWSGQE
jgi:AcrR family transcriptional regulator